MDRCSAGRAGAARRSQRPGEIATSADAHARFGARGELDVVTHLQLAPRDADPVLAARAFLDEHGEALGVSGFDGSALVLRKGVLPGESGPVIFERQVRGLTVFGGHVTVGIGALGEIHSASSSGSLPPVAAEFTVDEATARRIATREEGAQVAWLERGWSLEPEGLRQPVRQPPAYQAPRLRLGQRLAARAAGRLRAPVATPPRRAGIDRLHG